MTIADMRTTLGLPPETSDGAVVMAFALHVADADPEDEPVTLDEARLQLGMTEDDDHDNDPKIEGLIAAARSMVEGFTGLVIARRQVAAHARSLYDLRLKVWPVRSLDAIAYFETSGAAALLSPAVWSAQLAPAPVRIVPAFGTTWPAIYARPGAVTIIVTAGFDLERVPGGLKAAMLLLITALWNEEDGGSLEKATKAARALCERYERFL